MQKIIYTSRSVSERESPLVINRGNGGRGRNGCAEVVSNKHNKFYNFEGHNVMLLLNYQY
jgi:hypothetical protein